MTELCDFDVDLLREMNGENRGLIWGAAMSVSIEFLRGYGYVSGYSDIKLTDKGKQYLKDNGYV